MAGGETCGRERLRLASPGKSEGGGWGWAAGGLGVRAVGRRRARSSPPYKAERNSQSRRRLAPAARREAGERTQPRGAPGGQPAAQRASTGFRAPAEYLAWVFGGYFCAGRHVPPALLPGAESTACLGIVEKWFDNKCRRGCICILKHHFLLYQVALFICREVPEARASGVAEWQLCQRPHAQVGLTWREPSLRARAEDCQRRTWRCKIFPDLPLSRTECWRDEFSFPGGQCCEGLFNILVRDLQNALLWPLGCFALTGLL